MLMQMRKGAGSWVAKIFLGIMALSFVVWGIGDVFRGDSETTAADVGGLQISYTQLSQAYSFELRNLAQSGVRVDPGSELSDVILDVVLNQLIDQALYDQESESFGVTIGKETIQEAIAANPAFQDQSGQFSPQIFPIALANIGMSEGQYVANLSRQLTSAQLVDSFLAGPPLPGTLVDKLFAFRNEERKVEIVVVPNEMLAAISDPTDSEIATYFAEREADYAAPEYRSADYVLIYPEDLASQIVVSEEDLLDEYDANPNRWITPERRTIQQLRFETEAEAQAAYDRLNTGADFMEVAADTGQDSQSVDLGTFSRGEMFAELAEPVFAVNEGDFSEIVQSPLGGWLIYRVTVVEPGEELSFEEARDQLAEIVALERAQDSMFDMVNELDDLLVAGDSIRQAAAALGLTAESIDEIDAQGNLADAMSLQIVPADPEFLAELFVAETNFPSPVIETASGGLLALEVTSITEPRPRGLNEVRDMVFADWRIDNLAATAAETARAIVSGADAGTALADLEELTGYRATGTETLTRSGVPLIEGTDLNLVSAIFEAQSGETVVVPSSDGTGQVLARVLSIEVADPTTDPDGFAAMTASVTGGNRQAMADQHLGYLRQSYDIIINRELISQRF